jgi:hypothetical protein
MQFLRVWSSEYCQSQQKIKDKVKLKWCKVYDLPSITPYRLIENEWTYVCTLFNIIRISKYSNHKQKKTPHKGSNFHKHGSSKAISFTFRSRSFHATLDVFKLFKINIFRSSFGCWEIKWEVRYTILITCT